MAATMVTGAAVMDPFWMQTIHEILEMGGGKKRQIMYGTTLSYPLVDVYLNKLQERGLLRLSMDDRQKPMYGIAPRGRDLLEPLNAALDFLGAQAGLE